MIAAALAYKYGDVKGITEVNGEIVEWPEALGEQPTPEEVSTAIAEYDAAMAPVKALQEQLQATEDLATIARKLEDLIDHIDNGTPLSTEAKSWAADRKALR